MCNSNRLITYFSTKGDRFSFISFYPFSWSHVQICLNKVCKLFIFFFLSLLLLIVLGNTAKGHGINQQIFAKGLFWVMARWGCDEWVATSSMVIMFWSSGFNRSFEESFSFFRWNHKIRGFYEERKSNFWIIQIWYFFHSENPNENIDWIT